MKIIIKIKFLLFVLAILSSINAFGISYNWVGATNSSWHIATNWTPNGIPDAGDDVTIALATPAVVLDTARTIQSLTLTSANTLNLSGFRLTITGSLNVTNGGINNGEIFSASLNSFIWQNSNSDAAIHVRSIVWGVSSNNIFNGPVTVINSGASNQTFGNNNTVNHSFTFINENGRFSLDPNGGSTYNGDSLILINQSSINQSILVSQIGTNFINCPIRVFSISSGDTRLGSSATNSLGSIVLGAGATINTTGFASGHLYLQNCKQTVATPLNFILPSTANITLSDSCLFLGNVVVEGRGYNSDRCRYEGTTSFIKSGGGNDNLGGGNYFQSDVHITNTGSGNSNWGNTRADTFASNLTISNSGTTGADIRIAINNAGNFIGGNVLLTNNSASLITLGENASSTLLINGNVEINSLSGNGISFGAGGGRCQISGNFTIGTGGFLSGGLTIRNTTFTGLLPISLILDPAAGQFTTNGSNYLRNLAVVASSINVASSIFQANTSFHKTGVGTNNSAGGNLFAGNLELVLSGNGAFNFGITTADSVLGNLSLLNSSSSDIIFANNSISNLIGGSVLLSNSASGSSIISNGINASTQIQGNISIENTGTGTIGFGLNTGSSTLASGSTILLTATGMTSGTFLIRNFIQQGNAPINLPATGGTISFNNAQFGGTFSSTAGGYAMTGSRFLSDATIIKLGSVNNNLTGGNRFMGNLTTGITGPNYLLYGNSLPDTVDGNLTLTNIGTERTIFAHNQANHIIGGDVIIQNNGTNAIWLGYNPTATVSIGGNILLENNGAAGVFIGSSGGRVTLPAGRNLQTTGLGFNGGTLNIANLVQNGNTGITLVLAGATAALNNNDFGGEFDLESGRITISNNIFRQNCRIIKTGGAQDNSAGNNRFLGNLITGITSNGNFLFGITLADTVLGNLTLLNQGSAGVFFARSSLNNLVNGTLTLRNVGSGGSIVVSNFAASSILINDSIFLENVGANIITLGNSGSAVLASGKNLSVIGSGFIGGQLNISNFIQNGSSASILNTTGAASISINNSTFGGPLTATADNVTFSNSTFNSANFTKTGGINQNSSNNIFNGNLIFSNQSDRVYNFGNLGTPPTTFNGDVTTNNASRGQVLMANNTAGINQIFGNWTINNDSTGIVSASWYTNFIVHGNTFINNRGGGTFRSTNFRGAFESKGDIIINSPNGGSIGFGSGVYETRFTDTAAIIGVGSDGINNTSISFTKVTVDTRLPISLATTGSSGIGFDSCTFESPLTTVSERLSFTLNNFKDVDFTKTGAVNGWSFGRNTFGGNFKFTNLGTGNFNILSLDQFNTYNGNVEVNNLQTGRIYIADRSSGVQLVAGDLVLNNNSTGLITCTAQSTMRVIGNTVINNLGGGTVRLNEFIGTFESEGGLEINSPNGGTVTISDYIFGYARFNSPTATIGIGTLGVHNTTLNWRGVTVASTLPIVLNTTGTSRIIIDSCSFNGPYNSISQRISIIRSSFKDANITKTGGSNEECNGTSIFDGNLTFTNRSASVFSFNSFANLYNGNVAMNNDSIGQIRFCDGTFGLNSISGNLTLNNQSTGSIFVGNGASIVNLSGNALINNMGGGIINFNNSTGNFTGAGNLEITSPNGGTIILGNGANTTTFTSPTATISIGASGINNTNLSLSRVIKPSVNATNLLTTGTSSISITNSNLGGSFTSRSANINFTQSVFDDASFNKTGGGNDFVPGGNTFNGNFTLINESTTASNLAWTLSDTYLGDVVLTKKNTGAIGFASNTAGNSIAGNLTLNNDTTGTLQVTGFSSISGLTVAGNTTLNNSRGGIILINTANGASFVTSGNLIINSPNGGSVNLGNGANNFTFTSPTATISIGASGINNSNLSLSRVIKPSVNATNLLTTGTSSISITNSNLGGSFTSRSAGINFTQSVFDDASFTKTGGGNDFVSGGNTFNGNFTLINESTTAINLGWALLDTYLGDVVLTKKNTGGIAFASNTAGNSIAGNLTLNNDTTGTLQITGFSSISGLTVAGNTTLNNSRGGIISINTANGASFVTSGNLIINSPNGGSVNLGNGANNFTFTSPTATISVGVSGITNTSLVLLRTIKTSPNATNLITTGTSSITIRDSRISGNFTSISNSIIIQTNRFLGDLTVSKTGTIDNVCGGSNFIQGNATFNIIGANYLMMGSGNADTIQGNMTVNLSDAGAFFFARSGANHRIDGNVSVNSTGTGIVYFSEQASATLRIGGNITLECASCGGVRFNPGVTTQSAGGAILTGAGGINSGSFSFRNFTQLGSAANTLSATGTAIVDFYTCSFGGNFDINAPRILMRESTFSGTTNFTRNSGTNDDNFGGNTFTGNSTLTNNGPAARWLFGNSQPDVFGGDATFINTNTGSIRVAFNVAGTSIAGNTTLRNTSTGSIFLTENAGTSVLAGNLVLENPNGGTINIGNNGTSTTIQSGGTISMGGGGFNNGALSIRSLTLLGTGNTNLITSGNTTTTLNNCSFGGDLVLTSGQWTIRETNVNGNTALTKTQPGNNTSAGGNTFGGIFTLTHNSTDLIRWGDITTLPDVFVGNVLLQNNSTGTIELGRNNVTEYRGNISYASANAIFFGVSNGSTVFNGSGDQTINDISGTTPLPTFRRVTVNKPSGSIILNTPVDFGVSVAMISGIIQTTNTNILRFINTTTLTGGSTASHVSGPMIKVGNQAFDFPVGKGGIYAPISISAAGVTTDQFRAEYFNTSPNTLYPNVNRESSIDRTSGCEYWNLDRLVGTAARFVTIGWDDPRSCGVNDFNQLLVARWNGTQWINEGGANYTGNNTVGTLRSVNAIGAFSPFTLGSSIGINPLPITGISLKAKVLNRSVHLQWTPEGEYDNVKFELQRASSNGLFQTILEEEFSADPSVKREFFEFLDEHAPSGNLYYRVIAWEGDQKTLSNTEFIYLEPTETSIYPNLLESGESINIFSEIEDLNAVVSLQTINGMSSELIKTGLAAGEQSIYLGDRAPGVYFLMILSPDAGTQIREKIVIR